MAQSHLVAYSLWMVLYLDPSIDSTRHPIQSWIACSPMNQLSTTTCSYAVSVTNTLLLLNRHDFTEETNMVDSGAFDSSIKVFNDT